jgi:hypothetical protein
MKPHISFLVVSVFSKWLWKKQELFFLRLRRWGFWGLCGKGLSLMRRERGRKLSTHRQRRRRRRRRKRPIKGKAAPKASTVSLSPACLGT